MKPNLPSIASSLILLAAAAAPAATPVANPASEGIAYRWGLTLGAGDSGAASGSVGQWSWEDPNGLGSTLGGWGHTSNWIALTLTEASSLQLSITRNPDVLDVASTGDGPPVYFPTANYFPSFTIWSNTDTDHSPASFAEFPDSAGNWHTYNNSGNVEWAEDLVYLDHIRNSGTEESVTRTWADLPAGNYTVVVGGLAPSSAGASRQGYLATFATVPEPGSASLLLLTAAATLRRRRA